MGKFVFNQTDIEGVYVVEPTVYGDDRGYFMETYSKAEFAEAGLKYEFVQDNQSSSRRGVLRGLHFQKTHPQAKLVRVLSGEVFDVAVDLREGSPTFGKWVGELLSADNHKQLMIPRGFAHGFLVVSKTAEFAYKCDDFYYPEDEGGVMYDSVGIEWPEVGVELILSEKDLKHPRLSDLEFKFKL
ncbi:dTDP-4-dehydrorhamnose 3,5-epimerase [Candidatus Saccharibacteria bacterium]|nr:dTDP-4-dehydrorhamnose 3,5-epimerase [Candidatus Saccharibacteria bacterium]